MSRNDYVAIYKTIIKKNGKLSVVYFVKWIQGDPFYKMDSRRS